MNQTPKQKASELIDKYISLVHASDNKMDMLSDAKKCAIILLDEMTNELSDKIYCVEDRYLSKWDNKIIQFWEDVKIEINNTKSF